MFENNLIAGAAGQAAGFYPYSINQSLRFNDDDSAYLSRTPATAGNRKTWTWSGWVKRGNLGSNQGIFTARDNSANDFFYIAFSSGDSISINDVDSSSDITLLNTEAVFRDPSSWYHIVVVIDTTQASSTERIKLWVNGQRFTSFTGNILPPLNFDGLVNSSSVLHRIGHFQDTSRYLDGYMAEINFIDGQALDPTSFGEFKSGVWVAKRYTGTYGTNGFYLPFENGLGNDESGNGNDWTANNLAATDIVLDSPTNNFATWNVLDAEGSNNTFSEGNLETNITTQGNSERSGSTFAFSSGKFYWEEHFVSTGNDAGLVYVGVKSTQGFDDDYWMIRGANGEAEHNGTQTNISGVDWDVGDTVGIAVDLDSGKWWVSINGSFVGDPVAGTGEIHSGLSGTLTPFMSNATGLATHVFVANFGQDSSFAGNKTAQGNTDENGIGDFYYTPPAGFLALCTANLPEPEISPADDESPSDYFNTVLYTGNSSTNAITGVGFQPDFLWLKARNSTGYDHVLQDVLRGSTYQLYSNTTGAEVNDTDAITSFDIDGFTSGADVTTNNSGVTYVAWNWKAGGSGVTNTDGSITSTVSANTTAGFSIVQWTGNGLASQTIGHGLGVRPAMIIHKDAENGTDAWLSWHQSLGSGFYIQLSTSNQAFNNVDVWPSAGITSTVITTTANATRFNNYNNKKHIAYCFAEIEGFSKFGSYTGNGSNDGPFVYTGFRPAFVLIKRTDASGLSWYIKDTERNLYNVADLQLYANLTDAEATSSAASNDMLSNGFKLRGTSGGVNASGGTYIYACFAENPFKYSLAR